MRTFVFQRVKGMSPQVVFASCVDVEGWATRQYRDFEHGLLEVLAHFPRCLGYD